MHNFEENEKRLDKAAEITVSLRGVTKEYFFYKSSIKRILSIFFPWSNFTHKSHQVLNEVNFTARRGQTVGVIGRNGAGKSTLLGIICGAVVPTSGYVKVSGKVSAILELGAGFNPELTGRENAVLYTRLQGSSLKVSNNHIKEIQDFADIGDYFNRPLKTYSSGMVARLAFACAITMDSDVLVIDEALAVGDVKFQAKCLSYINAKRNSGITVIIVTHSPELIQRYCDWAVLVNQGMIQKEGNPRDVTDAYETILYGASNNSLRQDNSVDDPTLESTEEQISIEKLVSDRFTLYQKLNYNQFEERISLQEYDTRIDDFILEVMGERYPAQISSGSNVDMYVKIISQTGHSQVQTGIGIYTKDGVKLYGTNSMSLSKTLLKIQENSFIWVRYKFNLPFATGDYFIDIGCGDYSFSPPRIMDWRRRFVHIRVIANNSWDGLVDIKSTFQVIKSDSR